MTTSKYKFALTHKVRGYIEWQLEHYHEDKKQLEEYKMEMMPNCTTSYNLAQPSNRNNSDITAKTALNLATSPYIMATERSLRAIEKVLSRCDETDKRLIELIYWKKSHTMEGAGICVNLTKTPCYERINKILYALALEMGVISL